MGRQIRARSELSEKPLLLLLVLFGSAFLALGAYAGYTEACEALAQGDRRGLILAIFGGLAFGAFGVLVLVLAWGTRRVDKELRAVRAAHPDAPWQWKKEWASRRIEAHLGSSALGSWFIALFVTALCTPLLWKVPERAAEQNNPLLYGFWVMPLVGAGLILRALYMTRRWRKFGASYLQLETLPGVVGGRLRCALHLSTPVTLTEGMCFRLDCLRERRSGGDRSTQTRLLWQQRLHGDRTTFTLGPGGSSVPIEFTLPYECAPTDESDPTDKVIWRLTCHLTVEGVDYRASFEVPVFRTAESSAEITGDEGDVPVLDAAAGMGAALPGSKIKLQPYGPGGVEFFFGPARNPLAASFVTLAAAGLAVLARFVADQGAPALVQVGLGLMTLLTAWGALALWLGATRVRAEHGQLQVRRGPFGIGPTRTYEHDQISDIKVHGGTQWGNKLYYDIKLEMEVPRKHRLRSTRPMLRRMPAGNAIPERREAVALAEAMKQAIGIDP